MLKAYKLLKDKRSWIQGNIAQNASGVAVGATDETAVRWCLIGSLYKCYSQEGEEYIEKLKSKIRRKLKMFWLTAWNDAKDRKHSDVIKVLKELNI